jgi:ribosomal protein S5
MGGGMGWMHVPTKAENARSSEFIRLYDEAWKNAQGELSTNVYNGNVQAQTEALNEYARLSTEVELNASPENIAAKNAARAAFEAATHRLVNIDIVGNKTITTSRKADADSIIVALERVAPGSTKQGQSSLNIQV